MKKYAKVSVSIEDTVLRRVDGLVRSKIFANRSQAFQRAVEEKLSRLDKTRLASECTKLDKRTEKVLADEGWWGLR